MPNINTYFDKIYVINLKKRVDRRISVVEKLAKQNIDFEIVDAVDGYSNDVIKEYQQYAQRPVGEPGSHKLEKLYNFKLIESPGAWGYLKTYEKILSEAKNKDYKRILCFDDDILLHKEFNTQFDEFIAKINDDWKLIYLGATQHNWTMPKSLRYINQKKEEYNIEEPFYLPRETDGSFAIGIDASIYDLLLSEVRKFNAPFDSGPLRTINENYQDKCFVAQPNLVIADVSDSDIRQGRNQYELAEKLKWDMELYDFPYKVPLISVIMPAYNAAETIEKSIQSILNQTYSNIEVIIANDGSTDDTVDIVKNLQKVDSRIRLMENQINRGCYYVRNDALRIAKGTIIAIQDADDISLPDRLEKQLIPIISGEAKYTISRIYRSRCKVSELNIEKPDQMIKLVESRRVKNQYGKYDYRDKKILGFNSSMYHRSLFEEIGLFWEHRFAADAEYAERILFHYGDIKLNDNENIHSLLMECDPIKGIYKRLDEVLVISTDMGETNITNKHKQQEKKDFERQWRKRFDAEIEYDYPEFDKSEKLLTSQDLSELEELKSKYDAYKQKTEARLFAKDQMIEAGRLQIKNLENDLSWYSRTYDHLPKWYLKIGGIFRRWPFKKSKD